MAPLLPGRRLRSGLRCKTEPLEQLEEVAQARRAAPWRVRGWDRQGWGPPTSTGVAARQSLQGKKQPSVAQQERRSPLTALGIRGTGGGLSRLAALFRAFWSKAGSPGEALRHSLPPRLPRAPEMERQGASAGPPAAWSSRAVGRVWSETGGRGEAVRRLGSGRDTGAPGVSPFPVTEAQPKGRPGRKRPRATRRLSKDAGKGERAPGGAASPGGSWSQVASRASSRGRSQPWRPLRR